ncbi:hypothetical protein B0H17DRAFT_1332334 [Mycena rosella]|uniref:Uncharacterized protein n=1 Tax=Mycena rosella TaxID=1033263 RepID=A0AAD7DC00_MYCRO|nr:hypothetical protein B0H17DRAFT_1332334 [Mycena rosella]
MEKLHKSPSKFLETLSATVLDLAFDRTPPLDNINKMPSEVFGSLVAAICVNLILYTLEVVMACQFLGKPSEHGPGRLSKFRVCLNLMIDTVATLIGCGFLFMIQGSHWGSNDDVQYHYWRIVVGVLTASTAASVITQSFLLERFWKNIRQHLLGTAFAVTFLVVAVFVSVAAVVVCAYLQWINAPVVIPFVWVALIGNVIAALGITTVSVCQRIVLKTGPGAPRKKIIARSTRAFIETGFPSAILFVLALVAWALGRKGDFVVALYFVQARVYSCTMLFTLRNPLPARTDAWIEDMVSTSVPQKRVPVPPLSPDIYLHNDKSDRATLCGIPEEKEVQGWYNIDLNTDAARSSEDTAREVPATAVVFHRNSAFYQVHDEEKQ